MLGELAMMLAEGALNVWREEKLSDSRSVIASPQRLKAWFRSTLYAMPEGIT